MKKHEVILDMNCNVFTFWPDYFTHLGTIWPCKIEPHAKQSYFAEPHAELYASVLTKTLKQKSNALPDLLPYLLLSTQGVSKIAKVPK